MGRIPSHFLGNPNFTETYRYFLDSLDQSDYAAYNDQVFYIIPKIVSLESRKRRGLVDPVRLSSSAYMLNELVQLGVTDANPAVSRYARPTTSSALSAPTPTL
ncbi:hypothetical protein VC83_04785 [Pseudogymnoascus destructans]|uniref:Uncharacterized protein n=2 Tax=Pseudogymnoascus destructans TaxID=655981 RepID=L8G1Q6_PSED2|nr:uncharacterized protein VC83_04785 [Pseudogymnoascus destructans]ELR06603.1 hypothetical protein GMDG_08076 [Pseudogymnoascus destructans 20631-21]OAF57483.1 hypothetical protein VC83_04785 [Pseudogymnoascus destructans]